LKRTFFANALSRSLENKSYKKFSQPNVYKKKYISMEIKSKMFQICRNVKYGQNDMAKRLIVDNMDFMNKSNIKTILDMAINSLNEEILEFLVINDFFGMGVDLKNCTIKYDKIEYYSKIDLLRKMIIYKKNNI
jgi:hypothetical protein